MGYRNIGPEDGWSDPVYVDDWGNIVPLERVLEERRQQQIVDRVKAELKAEAEAEVKRKAMPHVFYESKEIQEQCEKDLAELKREKELKDQKVSALSQLCELVSVVMCRSCPNHSVDQCGNCTLPDWLDEIKGALKGGDGK